MNKKLLFIAMAWSCGAMAMESCGTVDVGLVRYGGTPKLNLSQLSREELEKRYKQAKALIAQLEHEKAAQRIALAQQGPLKMGDLFH